MAIALSLWLGFLACILGCAQPVSASALSTPARISERKTVTNELHNDWMADTGPCCHHSRKRSEKHQQDATTVSCCPLDATLIQKQDPTPPSRIFFLVFVSALLVLATAVPFSASTDTEAPTPWRAGRDILLQAHILRI
jgi:hypothetical protein